MDPYRVSRPQRNNRTLQQRLRHLTINHTTPGYPVLMIDIDELRQRDRERRQQRQGFCMQIPNQPQNIQLRKDQFYTLILNTEPVSGTFHIIARRFNYKCFPIRHMDPGTSDWICPFEIKPPTPVTYQFIPWPHDIIHNGATITLQGSTSIEIRFLMESKTRSFRERQYNITKELGKIWQLLLLQTSTGRILAAMDFEVLGSEDENEN